MSSLGCFESACELFSASCFATRLNLLPSCHLGLKARIRVQLALHFSAAAFPEKWLRGRARIGNFV